MVGLRLCVKDILPVSTPFIFEFSVDLLMCFFNLSNVTDKMFQSVFQVIVSFVTMTTTTSSFSIGYHDQLKFDAGSSGCST